MTGSDLISRDLNVELSRINHNNFTKRMKCVTPEGEMAGSNNGVVGVVASFAQISAADF